MRLATLTIVLFLLGCSGEPEPAPVPQPAAADDPQAGLLPAVRRYVKAMRSKDLEGMLAMTRPSDRASLKEDAQGFLGAKHPAFVADIIEPIETALERGQKLKRVVEGEEGETFQLAYGSKPAGIDVRATLVLKRIDGKWFVLDID